MDILSTDDLLYTNSFTLADPHQGYGLTDELQRFKLREYVEEQKRNQETDTPAAAVEPALGESLEPNDLMNTNRVIKDNGEPRNINARRVFKETRHLFTVDSRKRILKDQPNAIANINKYQSILTDTADAAVPPYGCFTLFHGLFSYYETYVIYQGLVAHDPNIPVLLEILHAAYDPLKSLSDKFYASYLSTATGAGYDLTVNSNSGPSLLQPKQNAAQAFFAAFAPTAFRPQMVLIAIWMNALIANYPANPYHWNKLANDGGIWEPFFVDENVIKEHPPFNKPQSYHFMLPELHNCKSIRLISSAIPNTIANITPRNNIVFLSFAKKTPHGEYVLVDGFKVIHLDVGQYDVEGITAHLMDKLNMALRSHHTDLHKLAFSVVYRATTGQIAIRLLGDPPPTDMRFHLKFYSTLLSSLVIPPLTRKVMRFTEELWFMLGFPWPCQLDKVGLDVYASEFSNTIYQAHPILSAAVGGTQYYAKSYRRPHLSINEIYLVLNDYSLLSTSSSRNNFSKITLNVPPGTIAYDTYMHGPYIFPKLTDIVTPLKVHWIYEDGTPVDFAGVEHSFVLEIIQYTSSADVNDYNTRMGYIDNTSYPEYFAGSGV